MAPMLHVIFKAATLAAWVGTFAMAAMTHQDTGYIPPEMVAQVIVAAARKAG